MSSRVLELLDGVVELVRSLDGDAGSAGDSPDDVIRRLGRSVIRPLDAAIAQLTARSDPLTDHGHPAGIGRSKEPADRVWQLAQDATRLSLIEGVPLELIEATAALQDLACMLAPDEAEWRRTALAALQAGVPPTIQVLPDGPYLVANAPSVRDWLGIDVPVTPRVALCRCGQSELKPVCDGSHAEIGFDDAKSPDRVPDRRDTYVGEQVTLHDNRGLCAHSGFCTDRLAPVFRAGQEPFVAPSGGRMDEIIRAVRACPSGALSFSIGEQEARVQVDQDREPSIEISRDGPYRVTGGIPLVDADGGAVPRNQGASLEHYSLCRCGQSQNKPFCSGMHWYVAFHDPPLSDEPSVFEWAGGYPALLRTTRLFYEKYVPEDPLLAPLFAEMSPDHPERVAAWLSETFGGPRLYTSRYGGYDRMVSQHAGKSLTEEHRAHWVRSLLQAADDARLPTDPEFRAAFVSYIEWGSRIAVENSAPGAKPPEHMPVPRWWWACDATPWSRRSAVAPDDEADEDEAQPEVRLPGPEDEVHFDEHVKPLFRSKDRQSMRFAFDLWAYDDVRQHADAILDRLQSGSMPCDGAWPPERVDVFQRWITGGRRA